MGLSRSTFYDAPAVVMAPDDILARIRAICDEFECYGYRRVGAALRHQGVVVNNKRLRRLMKAHDLQPRQRRRYVVTTDSDHDSPIFPDLVKDVVLERPNQLWIADLTYVTISGGFVYLAAILDAWSRKVIGYSIRAVSDRRESALGDLDSQDVSNGRVSLMHRFAGTACLALILLIYESV